MNRIKLSSPRTDQITENYAFLNWCIVHYAFLHTRTATHHGCNEFVHCCMPRPQSIVVHIASMANIRMSLSHSRHLQCYLEIRYIHGALQPGYAKMRNAQCINSEDNLFWIRCMNDVAVKNISRENNISMILCSIKDKSSSPFLGLGYVAGLFS